MRKPLNLSNSIYQQKNSKFGLGMECGMMINNRPDSTTGIQKAVEMKKSIRRAEKISTMSEAVALGGMKEDMMSGGSCM
jgi:hypothetical protein